MENRNILSGKLLIMLVFGISVIGSLFAQTDNRINGKWAMVEDEVTIGYEFNNGNWESSTNGSLWFKGTYTINNGNIVFTSTHIHGDFFNLATNNVDKLDSKLYTINEFIIAVRPKLKKLGISDNDINDFIKSIIYTNLSVPYSVDAKTLILNMNGEVMILNKK